MTDTIGSGASVRQLLTAEQFHSVRRTVLDANAAMDEAMADRIVDEALKFVAACSTFPGVPMAPSRVVDEGWHALILHTKLYADLCEQHGVFVHHFPGYDPTHYDPDVLDRSRAMIGEAGYAPDLELWGRPDQPLVAVAANCQHSAECHIIPMPPDPGPTD